MIRYIEETMLSVINQGYPNLEYIVIDGGSTDGTVEIIKKYERYISYWVSEPDNGQFDALNKGFKKSTGEIMGWLCASDILMPRSLFTIATIFSYFPEVEWITGMRNIINEEGAPIFEIKLVRYNRLSFLRVGECLSSDSTYWKRSLWDKVGGFNPSIKNFCDYNFWVKCFRFAQLYSVQTVLGAWRWHSDSISAREKHTIMAISKSIIEEELRKYSQIEKIIKRVIRVQKTDTIINKIPLIRSIWWRVVRNAFFPKEYLELAPVIYWDFEQKKWVMKK